MLSVAWPAVTTPVPTAVLPSLNVTDPLGLPAPGAVTLIAAVKTTLSPTAAAALIPNQTHWI